MFTPYFHADSAAVGLKSSGRERTPYYYRVAGEHEVILFLRRHGYAVAVVVASGPMKSTAEG